MPALQVGEKAPDFELKTAEGMPVRLADLLAGGKPVILAFYPAAFSTVCSDEMALYQESQDEFARLGARIVGISVDNWWSLGAFAMAKAITFTLLSDFHPKGAVAAKYGVYRDDDGITERALFIVDPQGVIRYSYVSPILENPGVDRLLDALEKMGENRT